MNCLGWVNLGANRSRFQANVPIVYNFGSVQGYLRRNHVSTLEFPVSRTSMTQDASVYGERTYLSSIACTTLNVG
jgi:hypothetical protein